MTLTREQFIDMWNQQVPHDPVNRPNHPLWIPETEITPGACGEWFVCINHNITLDKALDSGFWTWVDDNLAGPTRCYMSDENEEWWGFINEQDAVLFNLKWA